MEQQTLELCLKKEIMTFQKDTPTWSGLEIMKLKNQLEITCFKLGTFKGEQFFF